MNTNKRKYIKWFIVSEIVFIASLVYMFLANTISNVALFLMIVSAVISFFSIYKMSKLDEYKNLEKLDEEN